MNLTEPSALDRRWLAWVAGTRDEPLTGVARMLDVLGYGGMVVLAAGVFLLTLHRYHAGKIRAAVVWWVALAPLTTAALTQLGKFTFQRARPTDQVLRAGSFAFPSGHSSATACFLVMVALLLRRRWMWAVALAGMVGMMWSRTYLGVHWLSDVAAGTALGVLVAVSSWFVLGRRGSSPASSSLLGGRRSRVSDTSRHPVR